MGEYRAGADTLIRATLSLADTALRARNVETIVQSWPLGELAVALDALCQRAEQADAPAREALVSVVDALNGHALEPRVAKLRERAAEESLLSLARLVRHEPAAPRATRSTSGPPRAVAVGPGGAGRPLTLGERKSLARRPDRHAIQRLLLDPHPDVVRRCLINPRVTEDDVLLLAAKRPGRPEALAEIARSAWVHRSRIRLALVINPSTPLAIAVRIAGLLIRPELETAARAPSVPSRVRAVCLEHLARRPPVRGRANDSNVH